VEERSEREARGEEVTEVVTIEVLAMLAMLDDEYLVSESGGRVVAIFVT